MRSRPAGISDDVLVAALRSHWDVDATLAYRPLGGGSYHWLAESAGGQRWFLTADDLTASAVQDSDDPDVVYAGLRAAFETAAALEKGGLSFVAAPLPASSGEVAVRVLPGWSASLYAFIEGQPAGDGLWTDAAVQARAARLIGQLHSALPPAGLQAWSPAAPHRAVLEVALRDLGETWRSGPCAEHLRSLLRNNLGGIEALMHRDDAAAAAIMASNEPWVVTHGEPHSRNFMLDSAGALHLIDWDTVRLAPRERDLQSMLDGSYDEALRAYQKTAGAYQPRPEALKFFDQRWIVADICAYSRQLRQPHSGSEDDARAIEVLERYFAELPA